MPRLIDCDDDRQIGFEECVETIASTGFDARNEASLLNGAQALRRLGNNPTFLGDILLDKLRDRHRAQDDASDYSPQAIVLSGIRRGFFIRANIWPSATDRVFRSSGARCFAYDVPHDHNFDFLTVGYFGPGYASDYWEYDYRDVAGYIGEKAGLRFVERATLDPGKLLFYRAHRDVHSQRPPESLSVSINVMGTDFGDGWLDQYSFDPDSDTITGQLNPNSTETFLRAAVALGDGNAIDLAERFGKSHPSERLRLAAYEARSLRLTDSVQRDALWREAETSGSLMLAATAAARRRAGPG